MAQRIRDGARPDDAHNALLGFTLGILFLKRIVSQDEYEAGESYAQLIHRHAGMMGLPMPMPRSPDTGMVGGGLSCAGEPDGATILAARRQFADARRALLEAGMANGIGSRVNWLVYGIAVENRPAATLNGDDIRNLRVGLRALAKIFR
jgi:hypothetical protein